MNMRSLKVRARNIRLEWEVIEPVVWQFGLLFVAFIGLLGLAINGFTAGLKGAAAAAVGIGVVLLQMHRNAIHYCINELATCKQEQGYDIDVPALASQYYANPNDELSFTRGVTLWSSVLLIGLALVSLWLGEPRWFYVAVWAGLWFGFLMNYGWFGVIGLSVLYLGFVSFGFAPFATTSAAAWAYFLFGCLGAAALLKFGRTGGGKTGEHQWEANYAGVSPLAMIDGSALGSILRRRLNAAAMAYQEFAEVRGFPAESDSPEAGTVNRGQHASSDALHDALSKME